MARCPTWTDHNVSDPGVTLIETFAYMTDVLLYRLNRVPDRLYLKFLELIGLAAVPGHIGAHRRDVLPVVAGAGHDDVAARHACRDAAHRDTRIPSCSPPSKTCRSSPAR